MIINLQNWRGFRDQKFNIPKESLLILDQNGSGKTSILSAFYSLFTKKPWPNTKFLDHLKLESNYFGILSELNNFSLTAKISGNGKLSLKYQKPDFEPNFFKRINLCQNINLEQQNDNNFWPVILTYQSLDNQLFSLARTQRLNILDTLLGQVFGSKYENANKKLQLFSQNKLKFLKKSIENYNLDFKQITETDLIFLDILNQGIIDNSQILWKFRYEFFDLLQSELPEFLSWLKNPIKSWHLRWEISDLQGFKQKIVFGKNTQIIKNLELFMSQVNTSKLRELWVKELLSGRILFGASRDDFYLQADHLRAEQVFSRGEIRLLILFIKNLGMKMVKSKNLNKVFWLLDDIFNELDGIREKILYEKILMQTDYFLASSTKPVNFDLSNKSLSDLRLN
jgi:recombinational DNA repair ATPase RecF